MSKGKLKLRRVKCTVSFYYDSETYIYDVDESIIPSSEEILKRCKEMFVEDITSQDDPFLPEYVLAEFVDDV